MRPIPRLKPKPPDFGPAWPLLADRYPHLFADPANPVPLKIGIRGELIARPRIIGRNHISKFLRVWCSQPAYVAAREVATVRVGLAGETYGA